MRRLILAVIIAASLLARPVSAAILPNCDQSRYVLQRAEVAELCDVTDPKPETCEILTPDEYYGKYPTLADQEQHPPTVTTINQCGFNDFVQLFINLANWGLSILAILGLLIAIYGGFLFVTAAGNQDRVRQGKSTIWGGFLGTVVVLTAWVVVGFVISIFTGTGPVLFQGTGFERKFTGSGCPDYRKCAADNLSYNSARKIGCRDDTRANGNAVSKVQRILQAGGCYQDLLDGCYGPKTAAAVREFQAKNPTFETLIDGQLAKMSIDGVVGPITMDALTLLEAEDASVLGCVAILSTAEVRFTDTEIIPSPVNVKLNGTVRWRNRGTFDMTIDGLAGSGTLRGDRNRKVIRGSSLDVLFTVAGSFDYTLKKADGTVIHSGRVIVRP